MDAHSNEYLAAATGMADVYGGPKFTQPTTILRNGQPFDVWPVGSRIKFCDDQGRERWGVIVEVIDDFETYHVRSHVPDHGNEHFAVERQQIVWPF